nr:trichodiene oxygenase [Quercus suber]
MSSEADSLSSSSMSGIRSTVSIRWDLPASWTWSSPLMRSVEGPVVRINPREIHVADPDFANVIFAGGSKFDKKIEWKYRFGIPHASFDTIEHDHHRVRRAALAPFFSKQKIGAIAEFINMKMQRLADRLETEYKGQNRPVVLNKCFTTVTFDIITYYNFARSFDYLDMPNFEAPFTNAVKDMASTLHVMGHFPWVLTLLESIPRSFARVMNPALGHIWDFHAIRGIATGMNKDYEKISNKTVFHELLTSDLPETEKSIERLMHEGKLFSNHLSTEIVNRFLAKPVHTKLVNFHLTELLAVSIVGAGVETTTAALSKVSFYLLDRPEVKSKLVDEITSVFPDPHTVPPLAVLESLPYLSAVVEETLRLTIGVSSRTIRKSPQTPVLYKDWVIPAGAYFSFTTYLIHKNPAIFEAPTEFRPERWLKSGPDAKTDQPLSKYLMPFGRGPRMCLGVNLARAELFIGIAVIFRRCNFVLFETTKEAIEMKADNFIPFPDPKTHGVRVMVV